jgi:hypothetical protein
MRFRAWATERGLGWMTAIWPITCACAGRDSRRSRRATGRASEMLPGGRAYLKGERDATGRASEALRVGQAYLKGERDATGRASEALRVGQAYLKLLEFRIIGSAGRDSRRSRRGGGAGGPRCGPAAPSSESEHSGGGVGAGEDGGDAVLLEGHHQGRRPAPDPRADAQLHVPAAASSAPRRRAGPLSLRRP